MLIDYPSAATRQKPLASDRAEQRRMRRGATLRAMPRDDHTALSLLEGCLRVCHPLHDGRRLITDFLLPGDGMSLAEVRRHNGSIEAVTPAHLTLRAIEDIAAEEELERFQSRIDAMQARIIMLGHKNAREKLASFLIEMADRLSSDGETFRLPMSRYDVADYLCLSPETVCRNFTQMVSDGLIALPDAQTVQILFRAPLEFIGR